jgi:hypothetical protein
MADWINANGLGNLLAFLITPMMYPNTWWGAPTSRSRGEPTYNRSPGQLLSCYLMGEKRFHRTAVLSLYEICRGKKPTVKPEASRPKAKGSRSPGQPPPPELPAADRNSLVRTSKLCMREAWHRHETSGGFFQREPEARPPFFERSCGVALSGDSNAAGCCSEP